MTDTTDHGPKPFAVDLQADTKANDNYRTTRWTGTHLQMTLMSIPVGGDIGLEVHEDVDQFLRLEEGEGRAEMGPAKGKMTFTRDVKADWAVFVPAGTWHNVTNTGSGPMKLYSIYAGPNHKPGTVHKTKAEAEAEEA